MFTETILTPGERNGDYARVGYIVGSSYAVKPPYHLPRKHLENYESEGQPVDVLTLGDSFSNSCGGKKDQYYQDWIATLHHLHVLNVQKLPQKSYLETLFALLKSGYLDRVRPKWILIQVLERHAMEHLSKPPDMNQDMPLDEILEIYRELSYRNAPPKIGFLNIGNFKFLIYRFLYKVKDNAFLSKVYKRKLTQPFFSVKNADELIFAYEDFAHLSRENELSLGKINDNLNGLADQLKTKGIELYFMPVVDKYNLYSDYLIDNPYPRSAFFETLRTLDKRYAWIDTKQILLKEVGKGEKDIFYADDSHWSWKAPKKIFETIRFR